MRKVALVTGASRGIGRACAIELARRGFDVAVAARTVRPGEFHPYSSTVKKEATKPLPGSLEETAQDVRALGAEALPVRLDLSKREDWAAAVEATEKRFGRIDVLVNNGRYIGPGHMDEFDDTPVELIEQMITCNVVAPLHLIKACLPIMKRQGGGVIIHVTSSAGDQETPARIGAGGWGLGYSITKAAFNRMVPGLAKELADHKIAVIGLMPGFVATERMAVEMGDHGFDATEGLPVENPGRVCAMLASAREPMVFTGRDLYGPTFHADHEAADFEPGPDADRRCTTTRRTGGS